MSTSLHAQMKSRIELEKQTRSVYRKTRRVNRQIFGLFLWRWRVDQFGGWMLKKLPSKNGETIDY